MTIGMEVLVFLIVLALAFDFMNGFHDAANSIATVVSTGVLKPFTAVLLAAVFNFLAYFVFPLKVAMATKLNRAANATAWCGLSTPVDTTVAIELAAS